MASRGRRLRFDFFVDGSHMQGASCSEALTYEEIVLVPLRMHPQNSNTLSETCCSLALPSLEPSGQPSTTSYPKSQLTLAPRLLTRCRGAFGIVHDPHHYGTLLLVHRRVWCLRLAKRDGGASCVAGPKKAVVFVMMQRPQPTSQLAVPNPGVAIPPAIAEHPRRATCPLT